MRIERLIRLWMAIVIKICSLSFETVSERRNRISDISVRRSISLSAIIFFYAVITGAS
jgi:hypothetical protein